MTQEEKAKRYDEALHKAKNYYSTTDSSSDIKLIGLIFPELKESDDEKIRKALVEMVHDTIGDSLWIDYNVHKEDAIDWLEKQGNNMGISEVTKQKLEDNLHKALEKETQESCNKFLDEQGEQKLYINDNAKEMFIKALERVEEQNNKGYKLTDCDKNSWWEDFKAYTSCTIEQKPTIEMKSAEESLGIDSDTYNKIVDECVYGEQKPADVRTTGYWHVEDVEQKPSWSEEDESRIDNLCHFLEEYGNQYYGCLTLQDTIFWLKSLKDRYTWKPSDEQMLAINTAINVLGKGTINGKYLIELQEQLKKLREE